MKEYILPILIFLGFGALSGILLLIASKVLAVKTDETEAKMLITKTFLTTFTSTNAPMNFAHATKKDVNTEIFKASHLP